MIDLKIRDYRDFVLYYTGENVDLPALVNKFLRTPIEKQKGRNGIKIFNTGDVRLVCRKYVHGGLLRAITGDVFLTGKRAINELEILLYLQGKGFPVVHPFGVLVHGGPLTKQLHILTVYAENTTDLVDALRISPARERLRLVRKLAKFFWALEMLSIYHPDLHLSNVLVTRNRGLLFLDFDKAHRKTVTQKDMENMFWRLNRFAEKCEMSGRLRVTPRDKELFLRTYARLSGHDFRPLMASKLERKRLTSRIGWFIESILYGGVK
ncbi:lipopolysaccharide kinase InaA family protein [Syntrophorhabdus aromaticivorans]|uniref:Protein kinase domain-containing protein n=1 Tax=Syntrophorhabdus aromaticivorans TaxID=328301 RepID=A0A351U3V1_9BACT|nr:lipopolysaccharide kinase InaA family protein [Syntrophorhabdus aromaticivorans]NLW35030.1 hypothetical protein [Syntrophorhabdus aromaticivorans]HBA54632.1 hypothetical protein [Syntrophorhabdus aromaticivorans]